MGIFKRDNKAIYIDADLSPLTLKFVHAQSNIISEFKIAFCCIQLKSLSSAC
jgi:hypothetical protein